MTLYNGVDLDEIDRAPAVAWPAEFGIDDASAVVACVANIRYIKAIDVLVQTAAQVCQEAPNATFLVIGAVNDETYFRGVNELAAELGVSNRLRFVGSREDVPSLLKSACVFYLPSRSEGLSNAMLEAMASGLACVATNVGGNSELVEHEASGYLVPSEDPSAAAGRILTLLKDAGLRARMGARGRRKVAETFSLSAMIGKLTDNYEELLATRGGARPNAARRHCPEQPANPRRET